MDRSPLSLKNILLLIFCSLIIGCDGVTPNNPYPESQATDNILYGSFDERPKFLDPARSYSTDESIFTGQIYEPPLQYKYQPNLFELIPNIATQMPTVKYVDAQGKEVDGQKNPELVAESIYQISIAPGILYQPHPAFAKNDKGEYRYHNMNLKDLGAIHALQNFEHTDTRVLIADDYVYEIKRLAWPKINSPIYELMSAHIVGLKELHDALEKSDPGPMGLKEMELTGVKVIDPFNFEIHLKGVYPQFNYWLAMPFFAPIPWEADVFYNQEALINKNIVLDWYPIGTGPYMIEENNPNSQIVMVQNPHYRDKTQVEKVVYVLEKESIPAWNKFLQGYYDASTVDSDNFASAIQFNAGQSLVTPAMAEKGISLIKEVEVADIYWGFNMHDEVIGGYTEEAQKLRQAISIALDVEEYIDIFLNGRGVPAQFILPPGIFGYSDEVNPYVYDLVDGKPKRKSIDEAKKLLADAGYPEGRDAKTGDPLIIHFDTTSGAGPQSQARDAWMRKQFKKLGIDLDVRSTDYNRFRDKLDNGTFQLFMYGWIGDYPDPENFLFLLYGPNGKRHHDGVNSTNYENDQFDALYQRMIVLPDGDEKKNLIDQMRYVAMRDAPMIWGLYPEGYSLKHGWLDKVIPNPMVRNALKYYEIDGKERAQKRLTWNQPKLWPIPLCLTIILIIILPVYLGYRRKEHHDKAKRFKK